MHVASGYHGNLWERPVVSSGHYSADNYTFQYETANEPTSTNQPTKKPMYPGFTFFKYEFFYAS